MNSNTPWSAKGNDLLDREGNKIATFAFQDDLDFVLDLLRVQRTIQSTIDDLTDKLEQATKNLVDLN